VTQRVDQRPSMLVIIVRMRVDQRNRAAECKRAKEDADENNGERTTRHTHD
jgi:hypothetical protein